MQDHSKEGEILGDYCDGINYKNHPLFKTEHHALQIILYYDELELCNPLGTSAKIHKIGNLVYGKHGGYSIFMHTGVFYYQLGNISPKYRSSLKSIHLVTIAKSTIIKKYGPDKILKPFMNAIKELEKVNHHT